MQETMTDSGRTGLPESRERRARRVWFFQVYAALLLVAGMFLDAISIFLILLPLLVPVIAASLVKVSLAEVGPEAP